MGEVGIAREAEGAFDAPRLTEPAIAAGAGRASCAIASIGSSSMPKPSRCGSAAAMCTSSRWCSISVASLVQRAGQVVTRDALIERVWKGRFVSDATVSSCIKSARKALGDNGQQQTMIRTIRGRGLQFCATVEFRRSRSGSRSASRSVATASAAGGPAPGRRGQRPRSLRRRGSPCCRCFPCRRIPSSALLGDALAQEIILELSRLHWLFVIARGSSFKFRGQEVDLCRGRRDTRRRLYPDRHDHAARPAVRDRGRAVPRIGQQR